MKPFIKSVSIEDFSHQVWEKKDFMVLLLIPIIFLAGLISQHFSAGTVWPVIIDTSVRLIMFIFLIAMYRPMLRKHWNRFARAWKRSVLVILGGAVVLQVMISAIRSFLPNQGNGAETDAPSLIDPLSASPEMFALLFYIALGPIVTSLIEDTIFRYTLLGKIFRGGFFRKACIVLLNAILFGLVHYYNFGSVMGTVPYMFAGLFLNLMYLWTRNIWHVLLIHAVNNTVLTIGGLLIIALMRMLGLTE
ncbi:CPBP family intramembrane glutamic endopeptidase [Bacillus massiliglaciei]|uniref:CPBP family intramembrane glutamic endopeptidase n=1 Tax=Bacillus massiliglaciei TaxID=1816693 RepID=UPI000DA62FE7|nr:type II CAAX endopeptidase family protein [Bacillus massiliglaciei]